MDQKVYICTGSCHAEITEDQYKNGLVKCGTSECDMYSHPFEERHKCAKCSALYKPGESHQHK